MFPADEATTCAMLLTYVVRVCVCDVHFATSTQYASTSLRRTQQKFSLSLTLSPLSLFELYASSLFVCNTEMQKQAVQEVSIYYTQGKKTITKSPVWGSLTGRSKTLCPCLFDHWRVDSVQASRSHMDTHTPGYNLRYTQSTLSRFTSTNNLNHVHNANLHHRESVLDAQHRSAQSRRAHGSQNKI